MRDRLAAAVQAVLFTVAFAISGALAGVLWERLWDAPSGLVFEDKWYLEPAGPDYAFSGTGWYVVVAVFAGALTALLLGWRWPRHPLVSLGAIVVGSMLAGWVMFMVGHGLGPDDPRLLAVGTADLTPLPSDLLLAGADDQPRLFWLDSSAFVAFPVGALLAALCQLLLTPGRPPRPMSHGAPPQTLNAE